MKELDKKHEVQLAELQKDEEPQKMKYSVMPFTNPFRKARAAYRTIDPRWYREILLSMTKKTKRMICSSDLKMRI